MTEAVWRDKGPEILHYNLADIEVIAPNFKLRFSGVTATIVALLPVQQRVTRIAAVGPGLPCDIPRIGFSDIFSRGWTLPPNAAPRIWHARRNNEMVGGLILAKLLRQPWKLVFTSSAQRHHTRFTRFLIRHMDAVISTSRQAAAYLSVPSTISMHGVDTERFHPPTDRATEWTDSGMPGRFGIGIFGRIRHQKGTDLFVDAMCRVLPSRPDWSGVIIGGTKRRDLRFLQLLRSRIVAAGLAERILLLGELDAHEIPIWMRRLSIVVAPPRREGFGLVPLEAMASGSSVIASRAGVAGDLLGDGVNGRLVPPGNAEAIADAAAWLMDMGPVQRATLERAARRQVESRFSIQVEVRAIQDVYDRLRAGSANAG